MGRAGLLERRPRVARLSRHALVVLTVIVATLAGGYAALNSFGQSRQLSIGQIQMTVDPGERGALDLYVPLVDWGVRFEDTVRLPARLQVELRTVDRVTVSRVAQGERLDVRQVRAEARDAIASYLRTLIAIVTVAALALGVLVAFALRHRAGPKLRFTIAAAALTATITAVALVVLLPPRGPIDNPQYYAFGPDIPRALEAVESAQRSTRLLDQELDAQLVGLARLVTSPADRASLADRPTLTIASDLHNNFLSIPILERAAGNGPLFFAGDLTDAGSPLEARLVNRVTKLGRPFVFVSGNHDSDTLERSLARRGAIVLTERGRLDKPGDPIVDIKGIKVVGYSDPFERRAGDGYADRFEPAPSETMQNAFTAWLQPLINKVDIVMVHQPALIERALETLRDQPPPVRPIVFITGHTHSPAIDHTPGITVVNGGSVGAGGTGNLAESTDLGIARLIYTTEPSFQPLAADLVAIDPGDGSATARRERLD
jgi:predicted phosphodiesterase